MDDDVWVWCLHCERAYLLGEHRIVAINNSSLRMCPYEDCDGDTVLDQWAWGSVREENPSYPEVPERKTIYPLYPSS